MRRHEKKFDASPEAGIARWKALVNAERAKAEIDHADAARDAFYSAMGLTAAQSQAILSFDKKHILDRLLPAWVNMYVQSQMSLAEATRAQKSISEQVDAIIREVVVPSVIDRIPDLSEAFEEARRRAYEKGKYDGVKDLEALNAEAQTGINTDAPGTPPPMPSGPDFTGMAGRIG